MKVGKLGWLVAMFLSGGMAVAQGTADDYRRAYALKEKFSADKVFYSNVNPQWIEGTHQFWYVRNTPDGCLYVSVDADKKARKELFDSHRLAKALGAASGKEVKPEALALGHLSVSKGLDTLRFVFNNQRWMYASRKNQLVNEGAVPFPPKQKHWMEVDDEKTASPVPSPDGKWIAFIKNQNIYVKEVATGKEKQLSLDGTLGNYYSTYIRWSPDSKKVASCKIRPVEKRYVYYVESSPADQLQPKLHKQEYAKPGDELPFKVPCIYEVESGRSIIPSTELFDRQYEVYGPEWNPDSRAVTFEYNQRGHQVYRVLELSAETGKVRPLVEETSDTYVNYTRHFRHDLKDGKQMIWMSERDNWNHLYMYNRITAQPDYQITKGEWYVREVLRVDEDNRQIYFSANGMEAGEDPYLIRYYRIGFDGKGLTCLTPEEGMHRAWFSEDMKYLVDVYSMVNKAPVAVLRSARDGKVMMPLETADITRLEAEGWNAPEVFVAKGRDGKTDMWGLIARPTNFDPNKKYPMIVYYYGGTSPTNRALEMRYSMHMYAALGYVVYTLNPSGTTGFGQEFAARHVNAWGLKTADEIIQGTKLFCKEHSFVNEKKIGCIGASYGGFMTQYLQTRTDIFAAAISHAGISALSSYWGEGYWGYGYCSVANAGTYPWNAPEFFTKQSPLFNADKIKTPLLLLHGNADTNVPIGESIQMFAALKILGKTVEFVQVDGENHGIVGYQKRIGWQNTIYAWFAKWLKDEPEWWKALYPDRTL